MDPMPQHHINLLVPDLQEVPLVTEDDEVAPPSNRKDSEYGAPRPAASSSSHPRDVPWWQSRAASRAMSTESEGQQRTQQVPGQGERGPGRGGVREGFLWILQGRHSIVNDAYRLHDDDDDGETYGIGKCVVKRFCRPP